MTSLFFFNGKRFDTLEEMIEYSKEWNNKEIDQQSCKLILDILCRDIFTNISMYGLRLTNRKFSQMIEEIFLDFMKQLLDHKKNDR